MPRSATITIRSESQSDEQVVDIPVRVARLVLAPGAVMLTGLIVALADGVDENAGGFLLAVGLTLATSGAVCGIGRVWSWRGRPQTALLVAWMLGSVLAAIPFLVIGLRSPNGAAGVYAAFASAWFESVSGLTSCGLTMTDRAHELSPALQWYRSALEWLGGLGLIAIVSSLTGSDDSSLLKTQQWEKSSTDRSVCMHRVVAWYVALTIASVLAFAAAGMPWWESINHGLAGISTGGFVVTEKNFEEYATAIKMVAIPIMVVGALSLVVLSRLGSKGKLQGFRELRVLWIYLGVVLIGAVAASMIARPDGWSALDAAFQWTSAATTCGFSTKGDMTAFPGLGMFILMLLGMLMGGMSRSTAGGIKIDRILRLAGSRGARVFTLKWISVVAAGWLVLSFTTGHTGWAPLFECVSAVGTAGLSSGLADADATAPTKLAFIVLMLIGRLEGMWILRTRSD